MLKVQQKVSGYFKTLQGAQDYCRIRSYVLTMAKNGFNKHEALTMLFKGT
jgi:transposase